MKNSSCWRAWRNSCNPPKRREDALKTNTYIAAKKISDKYKKIRQVNNIRIAKELQEAASKKKAEIAAKKINEKDKKMRYKKATLPPPVEKDDTETVTCDVRPKTEAIITANKIKNKYKKMRAKISPYRSI